MRLGSPCRAAKAAGPKGCCFSWAGRWLGERAAFVSSGVVQAQEFSMWGGRFLSSECRNPCLSHGVGGWSSARGGCDSRAERAGSPGLWGCPAHCPAAGWLWWPRCPQLLWVWVQLSSLGRCSPVAVAVAVQGHHVMLKAVQDGFSRMWSCHLPHQCCMAKPPPP